MVLLEKDSRNMKLKSLNTADDVELVGSWLSKKENYQWLDFGNGVQKVEAPTLKLMIQRDIHKMWLYTADDSDEPIGLVALSDINKNFKSAVAWCVLGRKKAARKNYTSQAVDRMIKFGFEELDLHSLYAWTLEHNTGGRRIIEENHFRFIGRRRQCHFIDGKAYDRLLYDLLKSEYKPIDK